MRMTPMGTLCAATAVVFLMTISTTRTALAEQPNIVEQNIEVAGVTAQQAMTDADIGMCIESAIVNSQSDVHTANVPAKAIVSSTTSFRALTNAYEATVAAFTGVCVVGIQDEDPWQRE